MINLSNVLHYVAGNLRRDCVDNPFETIYRKILINLKAKLKNKGKIIFYYFYRTPEELKTAVLIQKTTSELEPNYYIKKINMSNKKYK